MIKIFIILIYNLLLIDLEFRKLYRLLLTLLKIKYCNFLYKFKYNLNF